MKVPRSAAFQSAKADFKLRNASFGRFVLEIACGDSRNPCSAAAHHPATCLPLLSLAEKYGVIYFTISDRPLEVLVYDR